MRSLIKTSLLAIYMALALLTFTNKGLAQTETKNQIDFEILKGEYSRTKAKGLYKAYCLKNPIMDITKIESENQIIPILSITGRILMPLKNVTKKFGNSEDCKAQQEVQVIEKNARHEIVIEEITIEDCNKKVTETRRLAVYNKQTKKMSFKSTENNKLKIACEWIKI